MWLKMIRFPLFNVDGGALGGQAASEPAAATSSPAPTATPPATPDTFQGTPAWGMPKASDIAPNQAAAPQVNPMFANPAPTQAAPAATQEVIDFAGRKVTVTDPAIAAILKEVQKDYTTLQGTYTKTNQELLESRTQASTYEKMMQTFQQQQPAAQPPQNQAPTAEELTQAKEAFMDKFYEDPQAAVREMAEKMISERFDKTVNPVIEPIAKERQWNEQVSAVSEKYSDFNDHIAAMQKVLADMPHLAQQGLETVYFVAKGQNAQPAAPALTPEQLMADPTFIQDHIANNPQIQQMIVSKYLQDRQQTNQQIPVVMGGQPGGQPPAMPESRPTDLRQASKGFLQSMGWSKN